METEEENQQIAIVLNPLVTSEELYTWVKKLLNFKGKELN